MPQNNRRQVFIEEYLKCWNATEAARRVGYANPNMAGPRLILKDSIKAIIQHRIDEKAMGANEVLQRLAQHARGDMGDFMDISLMSFCLDLNKAKELGLTHLIKKVRQKTVTTVAKDGTEEETNTIEIELYDAQAALVQLGRHHELFTDNTKLNDGNPIPVKLVEVIKSE
jgi:phage terminase small subunit